VNTLSATLMSGAQNHVMRSRAHCYNESGSGEVGTLVSTGEWDLNTAKVAKLKKANKMLKKSMRKCKHKYDSDSDSNDSDSS